MKKILQVFESDEFGEVRTVEERGNVLFCGSDIARALGYDQPHKAIKQHCKDDGGMFYTVIDSLGREQQAKFINEGNLYRLIINSKLPTAEKFEAWVFEEVLPSIRKNGGYLSGQESMTEDELMAQAILVAKRKIDDLKARNENLLAVCSTLTVKNTLLLPKAEYFDELVDRNLLTNFRETAKLLKISEKDFINFLVVKKFIYRDKKGKIQPFADKNDGLFEIKETFNDKTAWSGTQTLITPRGRETFRLLCKF